MPQTTDDVRSHQRTGSISPAALCAASDFQSTKGNRRDLSLSQRRPVPASRLHPSRPWGTVMAITLGSLITTCIAVIFSLRWAEVTPWPSFRRPNSPQPLQGWVSPWSLIRPAKRLVYSGCFEKYQCARLEVPMDWNSTTDPDTVALAVIKLPARVPVTDPRYGGVILINPGGPGASGVERLLEQGSRLQKILDSENDPLDRSAFSPLDRYYDILGFDGRGVNNTTPRFDCIPDPFARQRWTLDTNYNDLVGSSDLATKHAWARAVALSATCSGNPGPKIGRFMNTTPTIADIIQVIEKHGEWREHQADLLLSKETHLTTLQKHEIRNAVKWMKGEETLQYWGFSYGTVTGLTFASMHPHRVKRLIVDGIADPRTFYTGLWTTNIVNSDLVMGKFFEDCHKAGPTRCSFYSENGPASMEGNLVATLQLLNNTPLPVAGSDSHGPDVITYSDIMKVIKVTLYDPMKLFPQLADLLTSVSNGGSGADFATFKMKTKSPVCLDEPPEDPHHIRECPPYSETVLDTVTSIGCTDAEDLTAVSMDEIQAYYNILRQQSKWMADYWFSFTLPCWTWKTRPWWRYTGPIAANLQNPILFIGNTLDPATPLRNAFALSAKFPGSVVLQQDSVGHCSYSSDSECTDKHVRHYFHTGELPPPGTICPPNELPWGIQ